MKFTPSLLLVLILASCANNSDIKGIEYSGEVNLNAPLRQFIATSEDQKEITLNMTGPHELTFHFNNTISHIDYEKNVIIFRSETDKSEWTVKKIRGGFELNDGTIIKYGNCKGWKVCLLDDKTKLPVLKGEYSLSGNKGKFTLWISENEKHVELLGFMVNGLVNRSKHEKQMNEGAFETVSPQMWTH